MQKWEYCEIAWEGDHKLAIFYTTYERLKVSLGDNEAVGRYIAQLGEDGWEMCGTSENQGMSRVYFKRPKL